MRLPNFIVIGAPKSGTTALRRYLIQHPEIFMSTPKEPRFFALVGEKLNFMEPDGRPALINKSRFTTLEAYGRLFEKASREKAVGEASVEYLSHPQAAERIRQHLPDVKLLAILRNPVEAAYSGYLMTRGVGLEPCATFLDAIRDQDRRVRENCFDGLYVQPGFYHAHLTRYGELFGDSQIRVYLYEDLTGNPRSVVEDIFRFLGVDAGFVPDLNLSVNRSGVPKSMLLHRAMTGRTNPLVPRITRLLPRRAYKFLAGIRNWNLARPEMPPATREELLDIFRDDIGKLQRHLGRDLANWLK